MTSRRIAGSVLKAPLLIAAGIALLPAAALANPMPPDRGAHLAVFLIVVAVPLSVEVALVVWLFRRRGLLKRRMLPLLVLMNYATWSWLVPSPDAEVRLGQGPGAGMLVVTEVAIVLIEGVCIYLITRVSTARRTDSPAVSLAQALVASVLANLCSVFLSAAVVFTTWP